MSHVAGNHTKYSIGDHTSIEHIMEQSVQMKGCGSNEGLFLVWIGRLEKFEHL